MELHPNYAEADQQIDFRTGKTLPDIVFYRHTDAGEELIAAEVKVAHSYTEHRVDQYIQQLKQYQEAAPNAKLALITPGELPQNYTELIRKNNIELWDRSFLSREFSDQIAVAQPVAFRQYFQSVLAEDDCEALIRRLKECPAGTASWGKYQALVGEILERVFCPPLKTPIAQKNDNAKKNRRDYILPNYSKENDIWEFLRDRYHADYIVVDAKNSGACITKQDVLQIANYLKKDGTGLFGIIIARKGFNSGSAYAVREMWLYEHKMIVVLNDDDIEQMLLARKNGGDPAELILKKIEDFRLSI